MATIKKIILLTLTALMTVGCSEKSQNDIAKTVKEGDFFTIEYDSCEYLLRVSVYQGYLAHKGSCKFCKERDSIKWEKRKKELEELVIKLKEK